MPSPSLKKFLYSIAEGAGQVLLKYFERVHRIERKLNAGIVTEADKFAEQYLLKRIFREFPESSIITEETGKYEGNAAFCWVLDPLDGTSNYAHGFPWFCVSIGLYEDGKARAGVVYQPVAKEMFYAERGKGASLNGKKIRVSAERHLEDALLGTGFYYMKGARLSEEMAIFQRMNEAALGVRRPGSAALDLAMVASGRYDGFFERGLSSWDVAAGYLLVTEAGGRITDYRGAPTTLDRGEVLASNGKIHAQMIEVIQAKKRPKRLD